MIIAALLTPTPTFAQPLASALAAASARHYLWISPQELQTLPTSGTAWTSLNNAASKTCSTPDLVDQDDPANVCVLAKALVFARTGNAAMRASVVAALDAVVDLNSSYSGRALALGRELMAYVVAADLIDLQTHDPGLDAAFRARLVSLRTTFTTDGPASLIACHEERPNNWGTHCGASRLAVAAYLSDTSDIARAAKVFKGWLGDRGAYAGFSYGALDWQFDPSQPVGINPRGASKSGHSIDGVLPDDQRRSGAFTWPPPKENYAYEALQGALAQAVLLHRLGYDVFNWQDRALLRAFEWLYTQASFPAAGDDTWEPYVVNHYYGTRFSAPSPSQPGKNVGFTDWTHSGGQSPPPPSAAGKPTVTSANATAGGTLNVTWVSGTGAAPTGHTLSFYQSTALVALIHYGPATTFSFGPLPAGLTGTYSVVVTAFAGATPGAASDPFTFTVAGGGGSCPPIAAPSISGGVSGGVASVGWSPVAGAVGYVISVGTTQGSANLVPPVFIGNALGASAHVPPAFQAWVRVQAVNACQQLGPARDFLVR